MAGTGAAGAAIAPAKLYRTIKLPEIVSTMKWAELFGTTADPTSTIGISIAARDSEPFLTQVKTDAELLMGLEEGKTELSPTASRVVFPWIFAPK